MVPRRKKGLSIKDSYRHLLLILDIKPGNYKKDRPPLEVVGQHHERCPNGTKNNLVMMTQSMTEH